MSRFKNLVFRTNEIDLSAELVSKAFLTKVFHLHQCRNEWVIWKGGTNLVNRSFSLFDLSLQATTDSAEIQRTQGTKFIIDEAPAICIVGNKYALIVTELFTVNPLQYCEFSDVKIPLSLRDIESRFNVGDWYVGSIYTGKLEDLLSVKSNEIYYSRTSKSTGGKSFLAWSLNPRSINCEKLMQCINKLEG